MIQKVELQTPQPRRHSWPLSSGLVDAGVVLRDLKDPNWVNPLRRESGLCVTELSKGPSSSKEEEVSLGRCQ